MSSGRAQPHLSIRGLSQCRLVVLCLLGSLLAGQFAAAQPQGADPEELMKIKIRLGLAPPAIVTMPYESRVIRSRHLQTYLDHLSAKDPAMDLAVAERDLRQVAAAMNLAVLNDRPQDPDDENEKLVLAFYTDGIEPLTHADRLWERMPRRIGSTQELIDKAITASRRLGQPIARLIITGHSGVGGTLCFGDSEHDLAFDGRLTDYHRQQLARLTPYLAEHAVIEIRQCTAGQGRDGSRMLQQLHAATGAAAESYVGDFRFGFTHHAIKKRADAQGLRLVRR